MVAAPLLLVAVRSDSDVRRVRADNSVHGGTMQLNLRRKRTRSDLVALMTRLIDGQPSRRVPIGGRHGCTTLYKPLYTEAMLRSLMDHMTAYRGFRAQMCYIFLISAFLIPFDRFRGALRDGGVRIPSFIFIILIKSY